MGDDVGCGARSEVFALLTRPLSGGGDYRPRAELGMPRSLTISTGLDALSHALESIWNHNVESSICNFAVRGGSRDMACLPAVADDSANGRSDADGTGRTVCRFGFSNTKTALAHSISYPITLG